MQHTATLRVRPRIRSSALIWPFIAFNALAMSVASAQVVDPGIRGEGGPGGTGLPGMNGTESQLFFQSFASFAGNLSSFSDGFGPRFNGASCTQCHTHPSLGGTSPPSSNPQVTTVDSLAGIGGRNVLPSFIQHGGPIREARFKRYNNGTPDGSVHQLFVISGVVTGDEDASRCNIVQPDFEAELARDNVSLRIVTPVFGAGLIEQIGETTILNNLAANAARKAALGISGRVNRGPNDNGIGRFGWKAQNVSLQVFSAEAFAVEMGISNKMFPNERDETPECQFLSMPNIKQTPDSESGRLASDVTDGATLFMKFVAPPVPHPTIPGGADSIARGRAAFETVGCAACHTPKLPTRAVTDYPVFANRDVNLFSDLGLHNMGPGLADDIVQGVAKGDEFRTAPLWGLGVRAFFLHDGRTSNMIEAILSHRSAGNRNYGPSEANATIDNYSALPVTRQQDLVNFLRSL